MRYLSLFSGVGGFELGIQRAFEASEATEQTAKTVRHNANNTINATQKRRQSATCIGYSEIDKYAIQTYERNFGKYETIKSNGQQQTESEVGGSSNRSSTKVKQSNEPQKRRNNISNGGHRNYGDATKIDERKLPDFDLLVGGFPCQAFSVAGKRHGFNDTRGTLFFDIARILAHKRPRHLVLENVKGLLSHDSGKTFQTILGVLTDLGYDVEWQVLNAKDFGVPQNRERIFIVGHLGGECGRQVFPITGSSQQIASVAGYISEEVWPRRHEQIRRVYKANGAMPTIPTGQGGGVMTKIAIRQPLRYLDRNQKNIEGDYAFTVDASQTSGVRLDTRIRRLTPIECERLMSWPDNWTIGSDTQRYKQCGNGVVSNVVQAVIEELIDHEVM